jgi:3',5'-cyclic AMP phosphodiesterase CpdA
MPDDVLALAVAVVVAVRYRRPIRWFFTHWVGAPARTRPYEPLPSDRPLLLRLAVAGDVGDSRRGLRATAASMAAVIADRPFDALLLLGDNVYPRGDPQRLPDTVFGPFAPVLDAGAELLAVIGNHDVRHADEQVAAFGMPGRWWARELGDVLLVGLDSTRRRDESQRAWLEQTLAASEARWKVVALHHPPYSAGYQRSHRGVREAFGPLFERHGVQLVLSGHEHDYQRSVPIAGVTYVVTGNAARTRRTGRRRFTAASFATLGWLEVGIRTDHLIGRFVDHRGRIADEWDLLPAAATRPPH